MRINVLVALIAFSTAALETIALAETVTRSTDLDRWMYPFNASPGVRPTAPVFGAAGETAMFDDFDGQFLIGFNTAAAGVPTTVPDGFKLQINSVKVTATHSTGTLIYDPTLDPYKSHLAPSDPDYVADADPGRPLELWGAGLRGGFTSFGFGVTIPGGATFEEGDIFAFADPTLPKVRNAYAFDTLLGDVSNVVSDRLFTAVPWAVGTISGLSPGSLVPQGVPGKSAGATFEFDVDLSHPGVLAYILEGIGKGGLFFTIAGLTESSQGGSSNANFYTRDSFDPAKIAPSITIDFQLVPVPEPSTAVLSGIGLALAAWMVSRQRRTTRV
jgi:hypothetical protein